MVKYEKLKLLYLMKILFEQIDEAHFVCNVKVAVSPHFLLWVMAFGEKAKIIAPDSVIEQIRELLSKANENYNI